MFWALLSFIGVVLSVWWFKTLLKAIKEEKESWYKSYDDTGDY